MMKRRFGGVAWRCLALAFVAFVGCSVRAQGVADVHSHNIVPVYMDLLKAHGALSDEGFPLPSWNAEEHLQMMDEAGISWALLSMPAPQPYFGDALESAAAVRAYNEATARVKSAHPERFRFCAALPLPDVPSAVREAVYALDTLGADGVKLATNAYGQYLGDASLDTLMRVLDERGAVVVLHPHKPSPVNGDLMRTTPLAAYEYPSETTRAVVNMIVHNVPARFPQIKFVIPHCGSFLPLALPRLKNVHALVSPSGLMPPVDWEANLRNFYYDLAGGATADVLTALLSVTSPDHLLYGTDYPYVKAGGVEALQRRLRNALRAAGLSSAEIGGVMGGNAARLFGMDNSNAEKDDMNTQTPKNGKMLVRISEIEVYPEYLEAYLDFALTVGETSVREEPGVIAIFPMTQQRDSCQIRILEIYADEAAYKHHLTTAHFQTYKQGTLQMVKRLDLVDMRPMNPAAMSAIFRKMGQAE